MKSMLSGVALAALLAASPALAGSLQQLAQADPQQPAQTEDLQAAPACPEGQTCPPEEGVADEQGQPATTGSVPAAPAATDNAQSGQPADETNQMAAGQPAGKFLNEQDADQVLASELVGRAVYDASDESLGDVNDVIWAEDGSIEGVVVGVGGFLGIGEKNVAVNYDALNITTDADGNKKLVLDATADELAAAPEFTTQAQKLAEMRMQQAPAGQSPGGLAPAPLPEPAPAQ